MPHAGAPGPLVQRRRHLGLHVELPLLCVLAGLFLLVGPAAAANSTYTLASPRVFIRPPLPNTKLELLGSNLTVDLDAGRFYQTVSTYFASNERAGTLPTVTLVGYISFNLQGKVLFSFPSTTELYCQQSISSPSLCPYLQQLVANVPYVFGAIPSSGNTVELTLSADATYIDPITNGPINFLGANQALTFACAGTCEEFGAGVPPAPMPENATVDVRAPLPPPRKLHALDTCYKRCLGAWRDEGRCKRDCN